MISILLQLILITTIWVIGLTIVTQPNMALHSIRVWAENERKLIYEPIILCHWCMPTIHSIFGYAFAFALGIITELSWPVIFTYPLVIMGSSASSGLIWTWYLKMEAQTNYYNNGAEIYEMRKAKLLEKEAYEKQEYVKD